MKLRILAPFIPCAVAAALCLQAHAATTTVAYTPNLLIPDNSIVGVADTQTIASPIDNITSLTVSLEITGGFNGDFYAYLTHGSGFSVLLNRVGRTTLDDDGYEDSGFDITFDEISLDDIHLYQNTSNPGGGILTGVWSPDARYVPPSTAFDSSLRSAFLDSFHGLDANGDWTLFVADVSPIGTGTLASWGMEITGTIPEPGTTGLLLFAVVIFTGRRRGITRSR